MISIFGIIPARYMSTRFPGKPLAKIGGKTMIERVYQQAKKAEVLQEVFVATDDERIYKTVEDFGGRAIMTSSKHRSGTDRCLEAVESLNLKPDIVINIQGDEPFTDPAQIQLLSECFEDKDTEIATLIKPFGKEENIFNPNKVKVVVNNNGFAQYFSRQAIPYLKDVLPENWAKHHVFYKHLGVYAYRFQTLKEISVIPIAGLENAESLEQLRWIENGYRIKTAVTHIESEAVDTPDDLDFINNKYFNTTK